MLKLKRGDMVYYEPNKAWGILLNKVDKPHADSEWRYALMSPRPNETKWIVSTRTSPEHSFINSIEQGFMRLYKGYESRNGE